MKVNERVRLLDNIYHSEADADMAPGRTGTIVNAGIHGKYVSVELDGAPVEGEQFWTFLPSELEVIE